MKILTLNLANYDDHPHWVLRRDMVAKEISVEQPDICYFQEVRFDKDQPSTKITYKNMVQQLADLVLKIYGIKYFVNFQIAQYYHKDGDDYLLVDYPTDIWEGVAIFSKLEPLYVNTQYLSISDI